jgi:hypothetical protein
MRIDREGVGSLAVESGRVVPVKGVRSFSREAELLAGGLIILGGAFIYPHVQGVVDRITPGCLFHRITGLPCLLCGMTRSLAATAQGRWDEALRLHLLGPPLFAVISVVVLGLMLEYMIGRHILPRPGRKGMALLGWWALGLLVAAWVARLVLFGVNV